MTHESKSPIEFSPGKNAIAVASASELPTLIEALISAVSTGELDEQLRPPKKTAKGKGKSWLSRTRFS